MSAQKTITLITGGTLDPNPKPRPNLKSHVDDTKLTIRITKGNAGIGYELARQLIATASNHVLLGSRSAEKGAAAVKELQAEQQPGAVELLEVDVDSEDSVGTAAGVVEGKFGRLDALVNNAGIAGASGSLAAQLAACYRTNVIGTQITTDAFTPLLLKSHTMPRVINVSSGVGSITQRLNPDSATYGLNYPQYRASKAGLNMVTACHAVELGKQGGKVFAFCPGFTVSGLGPMNNKESGAKPTSEGAKPMVGMLKGERDAEHGGFLHEGGQYPW